MTAPNRPAANADPAPDSPAKDAENHRGAVTIGARDGHGLPARCESQALNAPRNLMAESNCVARGTDRNARWMEYRVSLP